MRPIAKGLLVLFAFAIPWEFSLDLGEPLGNIGRIVGMLLLLVAIPIILHQKRMRPPGWLQWLVLTFYLWFCCSCFWTIDRDATLGRLRGDFQVMMVVWLVWEFADSAQDLRMLLRAYLAGVWVLAILTFMSYGSVDTFVASQVRFAAIGQDPNDVSHILDLGFPIAGLLFSMKSHWLERLLVLGYLPVGILAVLLTASRGGFLAGVVALVGCGVLLLRSHQRLVMAGVLLLPVMAVALWVVVPEGSFARLATIPEQLSSVDLNQRSNIWMAGWDAFKRAPILGMGAGSFVNAARLAPMDTAHNTALSILVNGGLCALSLAVAIAFGVLGSLRRLRGTLRLGLALTLLVWGITSLVATVEGSRTTWLLVGLVALAGRLAEQDPAGLARCFEARADRSSLAALSEPAG
jgi:O-antigen ligase